MHSEPTWFDYWESAAGQTDCAWQKEVFTRFAADPVDCALQLGCPEVAAIESVHGALRLCAFDRAPGKCSDNVSVSTLLCMDCALPLQNDSIDLVLWPHGFERSENLQAALSEIHRVLCPEGRLIVTFFNRYGSWALKRHLPFSLSPLPQVLTPLTVSEAKAHLLAAGLKCQSGAFGVYAERQDVAQKSRLDLAGDRWWPTLANLAVLCARKEIRGMHLVGKAQFSYPRFNPIGIAPVGSTNKEAL